MTLNGVMAVILRYFTELSCTTLSQNNFRPTSLWKSTFNSLWPY